MEPPALLALALGTLGLIAALPSSPSLSPPSHPELGTPFTVTCSSDVSEGSLSIWAEGRTLPVTLTRDGDTVTATATVTLMGSASLACVVRDEDSEETSSRDVNSVPSPRLNLTTLPVAGTALRGSCWLPPGATRDVQVRVKRGGTPVTPWGHPPLPFEVSLREEEEEEEELELLCQAELAPLLRNVSVRVPVLAKPRFNTTGCPQNQTWIQGQDGILQCPARGKPQPRIRCVRTGISGNPEENRGNFGNFGNNSQDFGNLGNFLLPGIPQRARRDQAGVYRCRAFNELGTDERDVTVWVQGDDSFPLLPVLLGSLLPVLALLSLAGFYLLYHQNTKIGEYRLWRRQPPPRGPPRAPKGATGTPRGAMGAPKGASAAPMGSSGAAVNGSAAP